MTRIATSAIPSLSTAPARSTPTATRCPTSGRSRAARPAARRRSRTRQQTTTSFVADRPGMYVVQLVVNDGQFDSIPDTATITIIVPTVPSLSDQRCLDHRGQLGHQGTEFHRHPVAGGDRHGHGQLRDRQRDGHHGRRGLRGQDRHADLHDRPDEQDGHGHRPAATRRSSRTRPSSSISRTSSANATIADGQGIGTIVNDDTAALPTVTIAATDANACRSEAG